ncbi:hypothetical protein PIB30_091865, partial [Stylosanthes scabra]|nr:hypothetical protein [Stylosanthes scabra]
MAEGNSTGDQDTEVTAVVTHRPNAAVVANHHLQDPPAELVWYGVPAMPNAYGLVARLAMQL